MYSLEVVENTSAHATGHCYKREVILVPVSPVIVRFMFCSVPGGGGHDEYELIKTECSRDVDKGR